MAVPAALERLNRHAPLIISAVIVVLFGLYFAGQINAWLQLSRAPAVAVTDSGQPPGTAPDLDRMESLFGAPPSQGYTADAGNSGLTLLGSFVNAESARSTAIIQLDGSPPQLYRVDQELEPGVRLQSVQPDSVEIARGGRIETLYFPSTRSATAASLPDYSEPVAPEQNDPQAELLQQQMEALRLQIEGTDTPQDTTPSDEPSKEDN